MKHFKSLAIIGASGMIGSDLTVYLKPHFEKVLEINRKNYDQYRGHHFNVVINANGNSNKRWTKDHVLEDFTASTVSVYTTLFDFPCQIYIYLSSADVYPDHTSTKTTNDSATINPESLTPYGFHKYVSECIVRNVTKNHLILRCPMMLGTKLKKGPIYDLLENGRLFVSPDSAFQMLTTKELANIITFLLDKNIIGETFNIGGHGTVSLHTVIKQIKKSVVFPQDGETHQYETNVSKLQKLFPVKKSSEYLQDLIKIHR